MGYMQKALAAYQEVEALAQTKEELSLAYFSLGSTYLNINELDQAEIYTRRSIKVFNELGNKSSQAACLSNLASIFQQRGNSKNAIAAYKEALALESDELKKSIILSNIAWILSEQKAYIEAIKYYRQAISLAQDSGNSHQAAQFQIFLGESLREQGKLSLAEKELTSGLNTIHLLNDKKSEADACAYLGRLASDRKNHNLMKDWYKKAEVIYREIGDTADANAIAESLAEREQ